MTHTLISFSGVTIRYADGMAYPGISFSIHRGEHLVIAGENEPMRNALFDAIAGKANVVSGKTTFPFFNEYVTENRINDPLISPHKLIAAVSARHTFRDLSNTSQFYYQQRFNSSDSENSLTVLSYLEAVKTYSLQPYWTLNNTVQRLRLEPLLDESLIKLSNGETKRVLIAAALLRNPVMLLLNNPLTGLDEQSRQEITALIGMIADSGITIVLSISSGEVPACIRRAMVVDDNNSMVEKPVSSVQQIVPHEHSMVDAEEIRKLLSIRRMPEFNRVVAMKDVVIRYGDHLILDHVNWSVAQGERWALLGHNGAGKSTLLSLINGDNPQAFANDIVLFDRKKGSGESIWDIKKKIGFFSSELYQYFPVETSCLYAVESGFYDTIGLFRPSHPDTASIAERWMKLLEIDHLKRKMLKHVSVVHQRLCLLARALVKSPVLLILDEPCQGSTEGQQAHFKKIIDTVCSVSNITMIYVSHYQHEIPASVTKTLRLEKGKVV